MENIEPTIKKESKEIATITSRADKIMIKNDKDVVEATEVLAQIKARKDNIEEIRKEFTQPLNQSLRNINSRFKEMIEPLENAERHIKKYILGYRELKAKEWKEQEKKLKKENGKDAFLKPMPTKVESDTGELRVRKEWKFKITNAELIPRVYLEVNEKLIRRQINDGVRKIPGIKIYQEENLSIYEG